MPIDDLYKNLKDPAPGSLPKFEEESWKKMEMLLDKHLPENNGRVFPYILFLGCIILASLTTFLPARKTSKQVNEKVSFATKGAVQPIQQIEKPAAPSSAVVDENKATAEDVVSNSIKEKSETGNPQVATSKSERNEPIFIKKHKPALIQLANDKQQQPVVEDVALSPVGRAVFIANNPFLLSKNVPVNQSLLKSNTENKPTVKKPSKNGLSLTFSAGLETPGTGFNTFGRLTPVVGVGLMYNIGDKLILRTGVATASKVYSAHDKDYNPANNYWASYTYFKKIDADCKVIEIPLSIAYRVLNARKTNVYVSAGSSSVIMRKESYEYYYKNQAGRDTVTHRAWHNNSFHLFSSVNFSAIAERKISNRFSLMAEPGIKIPSGGIGVGKIRLYNAGLTVTAKFKLK
jgi:cytoskeletal protein RodZ